MFKHLMDHLLDGQSHAYNFDQTELRLWYYYSDTKKDISILVKYICNCETILAAAEQSSLPSD